MLDTSNWPDPNSTSERVGKWLALIYLLCAAGGLLYGFFWLVRGMIRVELREHRQRQAERRGFPVVVQDE